MATIVNDYLAQQDLQEVIVIAHSKGGLIAKYALRERATRRRVRHVITITPRSADHATPTFFFCQASACSLRGAQSSNSWHETSQSMHR